MQNFDNVKIGDRLRRNSYSVYHFTTGKEYEVETFDHGRPRVYGDNGIMVTIGTHYSPVYFDHIVLPDSSKLIAGDLIRLGKDYIGLTKGKIYIVNRDGEKSPYIYDDNNKTRFLTGSRLSYKVVGKLSDQKESSLADAVEVGDRLTRIVPGGLHYTKGFNYTVAEIKNGRVYIETNNGNIMMIHQKSEENWEPAIAQIRPVTVKAVKPKTDDLMARVYKTREAIVKDFMKVGISEETATKAATEMIMKGLEGYEKL